MIATAVIDTGPLFDALVFNHGANPLNRSQKVREHKSRSGLNSSRLLNIMAGIRGKLTTSHVMGEINRHVTRKLDLFEPEKGRFWNSSIDLLTQWNLDEKLIRFLELARQSESDIARVGLVDTGLIHLAQQHGCILLTDDERTLAPLAWERGVDCQLMRNLSQG